MAARPETYSVASNPAIVQRANPRLHVLFSGESQTKPGHRLGPKVYEFYLMHLVLSGKGVFTLEGQRYELEAGRTFLIEPGQLITYESDHEEPWRYRWVAFKGEEAAELVAMAGFKASQGQIAALDDARKAGVLYRRIYSILRKGSPSASLQASACLQLLMAEYSDSLREQGSPDRAEKQDEQLHSQIIHYLSTQYTHPVSIEGMAESLGYSRAYLSRIFKQKTGMSPVSFLLKLRLDRAKLMLRERPELTVEQVAASVGLQDALYFSKQFRKQHGQSPTAYRKEMMGQAADF
ncbi:AraC family transcriptional regulator [Paenibacillus nanensis]|uniref:AraC family transcriptional regulator n=1 Tax=Paenibacillus nanensis TaxID=393251 RepID=A0A3A1UQQ9_9BACL|nr:AraC family transcriptional regulator [Paenibacillus nanensis]RIX50869.1 AraC family transcriptional regulator [Paenibacillus nanensis]